MYQSLFCYPKNNAWALILFFIFPTILFSNEQEELEQANYVVGYNEGKILQSYHYQLDYQSLKEGINDGFFSTISKPNVVKNKNKIIHVYLNSLIKKKEPQYQSDFSYLIGLDYGQDFRNKFFPLEKAFFIKGIQEKLENKDNAYVAHQDHLMDLFYEKALVSRNQNETDAQLFSSIHQKLIRLNDSIQYQVIAESPHPKTPTHYQKQDVVYLKYVIKDSHSSVINQSKNEKKGDPFLVKNLLPSIKTMLSIMNQGDEYIFYTPAQLFYKTRANNILSDSRSLISINLTLMKIKSNS